MRRNHTDPNSKTKKKIKIKYSTEVEGQKKKWGRGGAGEIHEKHAKNEILEV